MEGTMEVVFRYFPSSSNLLFLGNDDVIYDVI